MECGGLTAAFTTQTRAVRFREEPRCPHVNRLLDVLISGPLRYSSITPHTMKRIIASILTTILIVAMTLAAIFTLVRTTVRVTSIASPLQRTAAIAAELFLGVVLLLGTVWLATHLAVRIFGVKDAPSPGGPVA